jgi:hypothetical protein
MSAPDGFLLLDGGIVARGAHAIQRRPMGVAGRSTNGEAGRAA